MALAWRLSRMLLKHFALDSKIGAWEHLGGLAVFHFHRIR
jgi:hypothetical protein